MDAPLNLLDAALDRADEPDRQEFAVRTLRRQIAFLEAEGPEFWKSRIKDAGLTHRMTMEDFRRLPPLTKADMRAIEPWDLVPRCQFNDIKVCFGTSGTSGEPVFVLWTSSDWRAMSQSVARMLSYDRPPEARIALNGYNVAHLAGAAYTTAMRHLGIKSFSRHYLHSDEASTIQQLQKLRCNTLILAAQAGGAKSRKSVADLLAFNPKFFEHTGILWWIGSSSTFTPKLRTIARNQGVMAITNFYGSSEFGPMAVSCRANPDQFHVSLNHVWIEVLGQDGHPVSSGQRGRIVVSRLASVGLDGTIGPHQGSQILRLDNGDSALWWDEPCACGMTAPRIEGIGRTASLSE